MLFVFVSSQAVRSDIDAAAMTVTTEAVRGASNAAWRPRGHRAASGNMLAADRARASQVAERCARNAERSGEPRHEHALSRTIISYISRRRMSRKPERSNRK